MKKLLFLVSAATLNIFAINAQNINVSGSISSNTVWDNTSIDTVKVIGNLTLDDGITLSIDPGIVVDFTGNYFFKVKGNLFAVGSASDSIQFLTSDTTGFSTNSHHGWSGLRFEDEFGDSSRIEYTSIQYGKAGSISGMYFPYHGGAIFLYQSNKVYISHCSIRNNYADKFGGGIYSFNSHPTTVTDNTIHHCDFKNNSSGDAGGAFYTDNDFALKFDSCLFLNNSVVGINSPRSGGAIASSSPGAGDHPTISNSRFGYNSAPGGSGGAIYLFYAQNTPPISNSIFHNNAASNGGAISSSYRINLTNSILVNNEAVNGGGGALYCLYPNINNADISNCTIAHNKADHGGGIYAANSIGFGSQFFILFKDIFYNNESTNANNYNDDFYSTGDPIFTIRFDGCSFTTDLTGTTNGSPTTSDIESIFNTDPVFINPSLGVGINFDGFTGLDWDVDQCTSPCIDPTLAGTYGQSETVDYEGHPRMTNDRMDIGAYEAYGFLTYPQGSEICEGDSAIFNSTYFYPFPLTNSWVNFTVDGGANWWSDFYSDTYVLSNNTPASYDSALFNVQHDFGCGFVEHVAMLTVNPTVLTAVDVTLCDDSLFVGGSWQTSNGSYFDTLQTSFGCDSILQTNLTIGTSFYNQSDIQICQGDSILIFGNYQSTAGNYYDSLLTVNSCDSVYMQTLTLAPIYSATNDYTLCPGDSIFAEGIWQNSTGIYTDIFLTVDGCDSIIISNIVMNTISTSIIDTGFCQGTSIDINGVNYNQSGSFNQTFTNALGCDSILTINIIEHALPNANIGPDTLWVCDGEELSFGIDTTNIDSYSIGNFVITAFDDSLHFTFDMSNPIVSVASQVTSIEGCMNNDLITIVNNEIMNMSLNLPVINDPFVDFSIANMPSNVDFWYWSFGDGDTLSGNATPTHEYTSNGNYDACLIAVNACGPDTVCFNFNIETVGIEKHTLTNSIRIYPNPARSILNIESDVVVIKKIAVIDLSGQSTKIETENTNSIDVSNLPNGAYILKIQTDDEVISYRRFIKH